MSKSAAPAENPVNIPNENLSNDESDIEFTDGFYSSDSSGEGEEVSDEQHKNQKLVRQREY